MQKTGDMKLLELERLKMQKVAIMQKTAARFCEMRLFADKSR